VKKCCGWSRLVVLAVVTAAVCLSLFGYVAWRSSRALLVTVVSDPPGATVFGPGGSLGAAPVRLLLWPGERRLLRFVRHDCRDREVMISADDLAATTLSERWEHLLYGREVTAPPVRLETTLTASLSVTAYPGGAEVYLDGGWLGLAPLYRSGLPPGKHRLRVSSADFYPKEQQIELAAGRETTVRVELENKWAVLYRNRIAKDPGAMTNYTELAHEYIMRGKWAEAEKVLWEGLKAVSRPGARDQSRYFEHLRRTYTRYYLYPEEGADESLRPACKEIVEEAKAKKLYNAKVLQRVWKSMLAYDKRHPPKGK